MTHDPISGPIPREQFKELAALPFGKATEAIRKYDPLYARIEGEPITWKVRFSRVIEDYGYATVEASSAEEAAKIADLLTENDVDWSNDPVTQEYYVNGDAVPK